MSKPNIARSALKFLGIFILVYGAFTFISLVPSVGAFCNYMYRQPTEFLLKKMLPKAYIQLKANPSDPNIIRLEYASKALVHQQLNTAMEEQKQTKTIIQGQAYTFRFYNLFLSFYIFLTTLFLLSPIPPKEKFIAWLIGSILFYLYIVFKAYLTLLVLFNQPEIGIYQTKAGTLTLIKGVLPFMTLGTKILLVLIIWALLVFRQKNWNQFLR